MICPPLILWMIFEPMKTMFLLKIFCHPDSIRNLRRKTKIKQSRMSCVSYESSNNLSL